MNLKLEDWTSLASLGLAVMFVALLLSFYNFLIGPEGIGPERVVEPDSLLLRHISKLLHANTCWLCICHGQDLGLSDRSALLIQPAS